MQLNRDLCIDSSIMGMGRGAGNLNTEIIMEHFNELYGMKFDVQTVIDIFNTSLSEVYHKLPWGYSMYYFLCAINGCNPNYATYFSDNLLGEELFIKLLHSLSEREKIVFNKEFVESKIASLS